LEHEWSIDFVLIEVPSGFQKLKVGFDPKNGTIKQHSKKAGTPSHY